ncbi:GRIP and coiled-coil domain-containing protein 2 [Toxorhynchites rutilus septentrionalis]|uniref:GRIP and coiled-coil domain-containing protein 2 n=1 Tax=Toxorhynchites rutilus septentrionalis TaxID=329112 RepID=UPI002479D043|nr:GRIP and coiled-coil domain-containing protein 2 [Toxorhynchites rutilus septentrionalis]
MDSNQSQEQSMDSAAKKSSGPFESLGREDLIKKCKGLLGIAQKAKQAKDECLEENKRLKEQLVQAETQKVADKECLKTMQEVVDSVTGQKLEAVMKVDELEKAVAGLRRELDGAALLREQMERTSDERDALQRQIKRLTEENEDLLADLSSMEAKLAEGSDRIKSLENEKEIISRKLLEPAVDPASSGKEERLIRKLKLYKNKLNEISAKILLLKSDRKILMKTVREYSDQVPKWQEELLNASTILFTRIRSLETENNDLRDLSLRNTEYQVELRDQNGRLDQVAHENSKLREEIDNLRVLNSEYESNIRKEISRNDELLQKLSESKTNNEQNCLLEQKFEQLSDEVCTLRNTNDEKEAILAKSRADMEVLQQQCNELQTTNQKIQLHTSQLEQKLQRETSEKEKLGKTIAEFNTSEQKDFTEYQILNKLRDQVEELEQSKRKLEMENETLKENINKLDINCAEMQKTLDELQQSYEEQTKMLENKCVEISSLEQMLGLEREKHAEACERYNELEQNHHRQAEQKESSEELTMRFDALQQQYLELENTLKQKEVQFEQQLSELECTNKSFIEKISLYEKQLHLDSEEQDLLRKKNRESSVALDTLQGRYNVLTVENQQLQLSHNQLSQDHSVCSEELNTLRSKFELIKLENSELLSELKEINEILKERGGVISLQLSKISELEAQKASLQQKLNGPDLAQLRSRVQELEQNLAEKESELIALREGDQSFDAQSDVMSTSTVSRAEETARLREIDDSFEEKYNKLRSLAVKLKKKVAEQTIQLQKYDKERETMGLGKNLQSFQAEYDKLLDQLDGERKNVERLETALSGLREELEQKRQEIETLSQIRAEIDNSKKDKSSLECTIREYREQLQGLKREKEAFNMAKKEIDTENQKLKTALKAKEKQLSDELEAQKELKAEVERSRLVAKKANVLNLEMEAYEKSLAELNNKLEIKKTRVNELEGTLDAQEGTIKSLKSQIALLEQSLSAERVHSQELKKNVDVQQEKLRVNEHQRGEMSIELAQLKVDYNNVKLEIESNRVELSCAVTEKEKICSALEAENSKLLKQIYSLQSTIEDLKIKMEEKEQEVENVKTDYVNYKIRAQSVLRQNQNRDTGKEHDLEEEVQNLQNSLDVKQGNIESLTHQLTELSKSYEGLKDDKTRLQKRCQDFQSLLEESRLQSESILEENRRININHQDALKTQRLQNETLINCYKKQIEELQEKHSTEIERLQSIVKQADRNVAEELRSNNQVGPVARTSNQMGQHISDEQKISLLLMTREDGEGSESTNSQSIVVPQRKISNSSQRTRYSNRDLIPLDELLNSSFDDTSVFDATEDPPIPISPTVELQQTKDQLLKYESQIRQVTALLAEAERDSAKLTQLNELLKEEVRRQERSIEREKHIQNSEYLKNVIFKFLTLNSGDEKQHLVPVLNTILKLSPEETQKLHNVARGNEGSARGWTGILWN